MDPRLELRTKRRNLGQAEQKQAALSVVQHLQAFPPFLWAKTIGTYWPVQGELDLRGLQCRANQHQYLPILQEDVFPWAGKGLLFGLAKGPLLKNRFGIPEPSTTEFVTPEQLDLVLLPLVGFDRFGQRMGMGGGYYDRALAHASSTLKIGVGYSFQELKQITSNPWDVPLDAVVTEKGLTAF